MHACSRVPTACEPQHAAALPCCSGALADDHLADRALLLDFQRMLAADGVPVDIRRLVRDPGYAQRLLATAVQSANDRLRACAQRISASFVLDS